MKILVVEDQDSIRRMIEALLTGCGHEVVGIASGAKAIEACMHDTPHLVLLDLNLQGQYDGFEVCQRLRQNPTTCNIPIVVISTLDDIHTRKKATAAGATAYYTKPFSPIGLLKEIDLFRTGVRKGQSSPRNPSGN